MSADKPFLDMAIPSPSGEIQRLQLTREQSKEALAEMEKWGDLCSEDAKLLRDALRSELAKGEQS
jgi:hypothetical protein